MIPYPFSSMASTKSFLSKPFAGWLAHRLMARISWTITYFLLNTSILPRYSIYQPIRISIRCVRVWFDQEYSILIFIFLLIVHLRRFFKWNCYYKRKLLVRDCNLDVLHMKRLILLTHWLFLIYIPKQKISFDPTKYHALIYK